MEKVIILLLIGLGAVALNAQERGKSDHDPYLIANTALSQDSVAIYNKVDSLMTIGITNKAFPGAQLLVAKGGKIVFHKAYGFHTYDSLRAVNLHDRYDLASITKIAAALPALMKLVDEGKLELDRPFSDYWIRWKGIKDKERLTLREILAHQAGLTPYIVFLNEIVKKNGRLKKRFIRIGKKGRFTLQAYDRLFVKQRFKQKMYRMIDRSPVETKKEYTYSGLSFLLLPELVQQLSGMHFETYLNTHFYRPLGAKTMGFRPKLAGLPNAIVPTEYDSVFRKSLTYGWVHDENASLMGGISGNAGLFSTAWDLAKLMQLYLQYGTYNGERYVSEKTLKTFTEVQYPANNNRRGLGFDKPLANNGQLSFKEAYPNPEVSPFSFGHSGFTGTFTWADPQNQLVFVFLSNRVHPTRKHRKLYGMKIREALLRVFYTTHD